VEECSACKDTSIVYYFNTPCFKTPFVCKEGETCQNYYCSGKCSVDTECPYDWQNCVKNRCVDRCAFLKCANANTVFVIMLSQADHAQINLNARETI
jgi:hypothetical protein